MMSPVTIALIIVGLLVVGLIAIYNSLVVLKNRVDEAESDIGVQMKRRYDLIPNLVEAVKGYAKHERGIFTEVTAMRAKAMQAQGFEEKAKAENMLSQALKSLFAVAENYPNLKANENFKHLQEELVDAEDKIMAARRFYNANVRDLNTKVETFPTNTVAGWLRFSKRPMFEVEEAAAKPVSVKF
jgi:LemA protein